MYLIEVDVVLPGRVCPNPSTRNSVKRKRKRPALPVNDVTKLLPILQALLRRNGDTTTLVAEQIVTTSTQEIFTCRNNGSGRVCPVCRKEHKRNNMFFTVDANGLVRYHCHSHSQRKGLQTTSRRVIYGQIDLVTKSIIW